MSYLEDFLENSGDLPKDIIRYLKLIKELDQSALNQLQKLDDFKTFFTNNPLNNA